jgi:Ca-activated chloride channel family protein
MKMENEELRRILDRLPMPDPGKEAKDKTMQAAMAEFRLQAQKEKEQSKGFAWLDRLISKKPKGGFFMNRTIAISTAGIAVAVIAFAVIFSPTIISRISRNYAPVARQDTQIIKPEASPAKPAEETAVTQIKPKEALPAQMLKNEAAEVIQTDQKEVLQAQETKNGASIVIQTEKERPRPVQDAKKELTSADRLLTEARTSEPSTLAVGLLRMAEEKTAIGNGSNVRDEFGKLPRESQYVGRDRFEDIKPNTVKLVSEEPVSTFSIDVDTASYAFVRRALNSGNLPQKDAVRIEEMINYFDYDYPLPRDRSEPFKPTVSVFPTPWNAGTKLLHIGIKGYDIVPEKKPKANLTFLIDVSGSMHSEDKLPLLKNSLRMLVDTLNPEDTVAIAVYAGAAGTVLEQTKASEKSKILAAIDQLHAGGSTAGGEGIKLAYSLAEAGIDPHGVNRVILATDGDFNVGITDPDVLQDFVERKRQTGIYLSVLGFGQGNYNDALMQKLAQNGNGNAAYIDNLNEARKVLVDEAYGTLFTIAKDVKIQIEFNPAMISEYRLIGYETRLLNREDFKNDMVDAGDIGSGHSVTAIYEITPKGSDTQLIDDLRYGSNKDSGSVKPAGDHSEYAFLKIRYKLPEESTSREISAAIDKGNEYKKISDAPADSRFAAAVAAFGQLIRGDSFIKQFTYDDIINLARGSVKDDPFGYRTEFLNLVRLAKTASAMGDR